MSGCSHNCGSCGQSCDSRVEVCKPLNDVNIKKIIGVLSGKGGVGKSMVSSLLAVELARKGYKVGIMDADITGPSIAKIFGMNKPLFGDDEGIIPHETSLGIKLVSINMMLESEDTPVLWRGPVIGSVVRQFYNEVHWGELDYLIIDMPPGTSDVALSVLSEIPVDEIVMVTSPSKLVSMVVSKAIKMVEQTKSHVIGLVENMAYVKCDECGHKIDIYKEDDTENIAKNYDLEILSKLPIDINLANLTDNGLIENYDGNYLEGLVNKLQK